MKKFQAGAVALTLIGFWAVVMLAMVMAIDIARLYLIKDRLQLAADLAAMDVILQGQLVNDQAVSAEDLLLLAEKSVQKTMKDYEVLPTVSVTKGSMLLEEGIWVFDADTDHIMQTAVKVSLQETIPTFIFGSINQLFNRHFEDLISIKVDSVATQSGIVAFRVGSGVLRVDAENSEILSLLLNDLLQTDLNLDVLTFRGLLDTSVSLLNLSEQLVLLGAEISLLTAEEILNTSVDLASVLRVAAIFGENNGLSQLQINTLESLALEPRVREIQMSIGEVLDLPEPSELLSQALAVDLNMFDLVYTMLLVANKDHAIQLDLSGTDLLSDLNALLGGGVAELNLLLNIVEAPRLAIGPPGQLRDGDEVKWITEAKSSQVGILLGLKIDLPLGLASLDLALSVEAASGKAVLDSIDLHKKEINFLVTPSIASVQLGSVASFGKEPAVIELLSGLARVKIGAQVGGFQNSHLDQNQEQLTFDAHAINQVKLSSTQTSRSLPSLMASLENTSVEVELLGVDLSNLLGGILSPLLSFLSVVVGPLLGLIGQNVLEPLLNFLGVQVGIVDVELLHVHVDPVKIVQ